jgi:hypothetical protein
MAGTSPAMTKEANDSLKFESNTHAGVSRLSTNIAEMPVIAGFLNRITTPRH